MEDARLLGCRAYIFEAGAAVIDGRRGVADRAVVLTKARSLEQIAETGAVELCRPLRAECVHDVDI
jgi:hypothetical protein